MKERYDEDGRPAFVGRCGSPGFSRVYQPTRSCTTSVTFRPSGLSARGLAHPGVGPELRRPPFGLGVCDGPLPADFLGGEVAAPDFPFDGVAAGGGLGGYLGGGEHGAMLTGLRRGGQLRILAVDALPRATEGAK